MSIAVYVMGLVICWLISLGFVFFAGRKDESFIGENPPPRLLGAVAFGVGGLIPGLNLLVLGLIPLILVSVAVYMAGKLSSVVKVNFTKE